MRLPVAYALLVVLTACSGTPSATADDQPATTTESSTPSASQAGESVICDAFGEGGPVGRTTDAVIENLERGNSTQAAREAITGYEELAETATGDEREDLLALAETMNQAELSGEGVDGWNDASEAFYAKYAEQCDAVLFEGP